MATQDILDKAEDPTVRIDLGQYGSTGLKQFGGFVREEPLPQLEGQNGARVFREMSENDPVCGGTLFAIDKIVRQADWNVEAASSRPQDQEAADFLESAMQDMETPFTEVVSEIMTMLIYGFSPHEIVYKIRAGRTRHPSFSSKFSDGRIGWRALPIRSQDTIFRWHFDYNGSIMGLQQLAPPHYRLTDIPIEKLLLFRTSVHKNNPEGMSILRRAYRPWYFKSRIEVVEAIGAERDLAGMPVAGVPVEILNPGNDKWKIAINQAIKEMLANVRNDSMTSFMFPRVFDANGNLLYEFKLMSSGGSRQFDTDKIIQRYDQRIALSMLSDFMLLGQGASAQGSFAMHSDKSKLFLVAMSTFLDTVADVFNEVAIPRLFDLNVFPGVTQYPQISHGNLEGADLGTIGTYLIALSQAGMPLFPNEALGRHLLTIAGFPADAANEVPSTGLDQSLPPENTDGPPQVKTDAEPPPISAPDAAASPAPGEPMAV